MNGNFSRRCAAILFAGCLMLPAASSRAAAPAVKNPARGEFYTTSEMAKLGKGERERYCQLMDSTLSALKTETRVLQASLDSLSIVADTLRNQSVSVANQTRELNTSLRDLRLKDKAVNSYVVKKGDTLRKVAGSVYGDPTRWREIYEANKTAIGEENAQLKEGTRLTIPKKTAAAPVSPGGAAR